MRIVVALAAVTLVAACSTNEESSEFRMPPQPTIAEASSDAAPAEVVREAR